VTTAPARLTETHRHGLRLLVDAEAAGRGVLVGFSDRNGGISDAPFDTLNISRSVGDATQATENRRRVAGALGFDEDELMGLRQMHGAEVLEAEPGGSGVRGEGDGLVARAPGVVLSVLSADCVPVLLEGERGVAALHAGWRGLVAGVLERGVAAVAPVRAAWIGPAIEACCYEVGREVTDAFDAAGLPVAGERRVDPPVAARAVLQRAGVNNIAVAGECTACLANYFSYRRDGATGRQGGFIAMTRTLA